MEIPEKFCDKVHDATNNHSVVVITDPQGRIVYVNENFIKLSGYSRKDIVGQTHKIVNSGTHSDAFFADLWQTISAGKTWRGPICNRDRDGGLYWVDTTIEPDKAPDGTILGYVSVRTDITKVVFDNKQQRQFRENAEVLNQLNELNIPEFTLKKVIKKSLALLLDLSWLKTVSKGVIFLKKDDSEVLTLAVAQNADELVTACAQVKFGDCVCGKVAALNQTMFFAGAEHDDEQHPHSNEPHGHINLPIRGSGGLVGVLALYLGENAQRDAQHESFLESFCHTLGLIIENRQQRKHLQLAVVDAVRMKTFADIARQEAETSNQAKANFMASMSHEIRTPMNGVLGMLGLLDSSSLSEEQKELVEIATGSANSLMSIINDILDFSKYETDGFSLENVPFELVTECLRIIRPLQQSAHAKDLELVCHFADDLPKTVRGDATRMGQVLINLLSNAIKFTEKGQVKLDVTRDDTPPTPQLLIKITDSGIGMTEDAQKLIFERFSQADSSITRNFGGTGLGLAIVKQLVDAMHGDIEVQSTPGIGSVFTVTIPLQQTKTEEVESIEAEVTENKNRLNVLVAEDHPANQFLVRKLLEAGNHQVTLVENGQLAVEAVQTADFDIVLMDLQMPVMDGLTAIKTIRALGTPKADIPIIAVTADVMADQVARTHKAGANAHIGKPINPSDLYQALTEHSTKPAQNTAKIQKTG